MTTEYKVTDNELTSIADAIRTKGGTSDDLEFPSEFVSAIGDIPTGGSAVLETLNVSSNGTYTPGTGVDGYDEVNVNIPRTGWGIGSIDYDNSTNINYDIGGSTHVN